jgi:uncharacterized membrane protein YphA (DoxX/SURF4 family)
MKFAVLGARIVLGLIFVVFSANYLLNFLPQPELPEAGGRFIGALVESGYVFPVIKVVEFVGGVLLLVGVLVPLALTLLAPVIVNIVLFHLFLDPASMGLGIVIVALEVFLAWAYRDSFKGVLELRAKPGSAGS